MAEISYCKIHPAIGIARVGNSPTEYFVGPEIPGVWARPEGGYKDGGEINKGISPRVKRQAARFRIFGYDAQNVCLGEITSDDASITWSVHLANKKAEWDQFAGRQGENLSIGKRQPNSRWRNRDLIGGTEEETAEIREQLIIDPDDRTISGPDDRQVFNGGKFLGVDVALGEMRTDAFGRLLVLGGFGRSGTTEAGRRITHYANNDRWYDDISDGPVSATVKLADGKSVKVAPAWVIVSPPDFAPNICNIVTLYDVFLDRAVAKGDLEAPDQISFQDHVYPILCRAVQSSWVHEEAADVHGAYGAGEGSFSAVWEKLNDNRAEARPLREQIFKRLRNPDVEDGQARAEANDEFMPPLSGDDGDRTDGEPGTWLTLTSLQYSLMRRWMEGDFASDWRGEPVVQSEISPDGLDRAALEACAGGAFFPGIEAGWLLRRNSLFSANDPMRIIPGILTAGDVTKQMALPWQADFFECNTSWWPAQRPDAVLPETAFSRIREIDRQLRRTELGGEDGDKIIRGMLEAERKALSTKRLPWARELSNDRPNDGANQMVDRWDRMGFVVNMGGNGEHFRLDGRSAYVETETPKYQGISTADAFYYLVNIENYPDFLPAARSFALEYFSQADYAASVHYRPFGYTPESFDTRMDQIYNDYVADMDAPYWLESYSRKAVIESLRQRVQ
ncbi:LodA/GoxA family CTQ-dependent oxidase [Rhizobium leguminosarum]|uniref:L-lysine 6-oxidase n=1 Tax=Rhizobium leguminosarum TaxID=384 RepID=A0A7K3VMY5_RHILE|nr:LodA/GoxA family CTQ-dependent oxidase [Rhizobium leguminosarum]NEK18184.1 hypothetical protein [Rhizobium leguminosarum]